MTVGNDYVPFLYSLQLFFILFFKERNEKIPFVFCLFLLPLLPTPPPYFTVVHTSGISWKSELEITHTNTHSRRALCTHCIDMQNEIGKEEEKKKWGRFLGR